MYTGVWRVCMWNSVSGCWFWKMLRGRRWRWTTSVKRRRYSSNSMMQAAAPRLTLVTNTSRCRLIVFSFTCRHIEALLHPHTHVVMGSQPLQSFTQISQSSAKGMSLQGVGAGQLLSTSNISDIWQDSYLVICCCWPVILTCIGTFHLGWFKWTGHFVWKCALLAIAWLSCCVLSRHRCL